MSEFECVNGHLMRSGVFICPICGGHLHRMDGMTARELRAQEKYHDNADDEDINKEDRDVSDEDNKETEA